MSKAELTDKERILIWSIVAWFQVKPLITNSLMQKLYPDLGDKQYEYDKQIEDRIIQIGKWLAERRKAEL
jgi:hypothetical protein